MGISGKLIGDAQMYAARLLAVYTAPSIQSLRWADSGNYSPPAGFEAASPALDTTVLLFLDFISLLNYLI